MDKNKLLKLFFSKPLLTVGILALATVAGIQVGEFFLSIPKFGHYIQSRVPQADLLTDYSIGVIWAIALTGSILLWPVPPSDKRSLLWLWLARTAVTLGFMLIYEYLYDLDAYNYFLASTRSDFSWERVGLGSGTANLAALAWLHNQILPASYHALKVTFSMVGLVGVYLVYRSTAILFNCENIRILYILGLFPSILFWSSIVGKDPIVFFGICLYFYGIMKWHKNLNIFNLILAISGVAISVSIRVWLGPILLFPLVVFAAVSTRGILPKLITVALAVAIFIVTVNQFSSHFALENVEEVVPTIDRLAQAQAIGGSSQDLGRFFSFRDMIAFWPLAVFTTLFRPLPGEVLNPFGLLAGLENCILLILFLISIGKTSWQTWKKPVVMWMIILILTWASIYGFYSSANLGAAVRFKLQILPVFLCLLLYLRFQITQKKKMTAFFNLKI